jgi:hypothetical protein
LFFSVGKENGSVTSLAMYTLRKIFALSLYHCCHVKAPMLSRFVTIDLDVAVNKIQMVNATMKMQQYFPFFTAANLQNISLLFEKCNVVRSSNKLSYIFVRL